MKNTAKIEELKRKLAMLLASSMVLSASACTKPVDKSADATPTTAIEEVENLTEVQLLEKNVVAFINQGMQNGLFPYELDEDDVIEIAERYVDAYLMINQDELSGNTFSALNQDGELNSITMLKNYFAVIQSLQEQAVISTEATQMDYSKLFINKNDSSYVSRLASLVARMHTAIVNKDETAFNILKDEAISVKNSMISDNAENNMLNNPLALDMVLQLLDDTDSLTNGTVIGEDEADILNQSIEVCVNGSYVSTLSTEKLFEVANELNVQVNSNMTREQVLESIHNHMASKTEVMSLRSVFRTFAQDSMEERIDNTKEVANMENDSYRNVVTRIANQIDLSLHVIPDVTAYEFENANPWGPNNYQGEAPTVGSTKTTYTNVPAGEQKGETTYRDSQGNVTTQKDLENKQAEMNKGYAAAKSDYINKSTAGYNSLTTATARNAYNEAMAQYKAAEKAAEEYNKKAEENATYIPVETSTPKPTATPNPTSTPTSGGSEEIIYVDGAEEEVVEVVTLKP